MKNMKSLFALVILFSSIAGADIVADFKALDKARKGPFTSNYLQYSRGRGTLGGEGTDGCFSSNGGGGRAQFQAAYRGSVAQRLAAQDFYVGNLFTTNYYTLTGEYVFGKPCGSHEDDPVGLWEKADQAMPKATSMVRHWVLEKHYVEHFPNSALAKGFKLRGISDTANEAQYAQMFFDFYLSSMKEESQFLPAYLLVKESPVGQSSQIDKARQIVADSYDAFALAQCGSTESRCNAYVKRLYQLRNAVHNQLSPDVINQIDQFYVDFPQYKRGGNTYLQKVQQILRDFYSFSVKRIIEQAKVAKEGEVQAMATAISTGGLNAGSLLALAQKGADLRSKIGTMSTKRVETFVLISLISQYINKEINTMKTVESKDTLLALLNIIYMEGFLIKDNFDEFAKDMAAAPDTATAGAALGDVIEIGQATLEMSMDPALAQWISVEPQMQYFIDNVVKSSSLDTASLVAGKLKK